MRLIDADKLIEDLKESYDECEIQTVLEYFGIYEFIKEQPTAYDVDKVVKELEKESELIRPVGWAYPQEVISTRCVIETIKRGGIDE